MDVEIKQLFILRKKLLLNLKKYNIIMFIYEL